MPAVRMADGSVRFISAGSRGVEGFLWLPCGQCIGCRLERARQWAVRCVHESQVHENNCFITLTYAETGPSLVYRDFQLFIKRLRKHAGVKLSYYVGGEYGSDGGRPHFHACIFGFDFSDKVYLKKGSDGESKLYTSDTLDRLWGLGLCSVGSVSFASAGYIARYCVAKVNGQLAESHYRVVTDDGEIIDRVPEFNRMSLKPAIARGWFERYKSDVYPRDFVVINGARCKPPKYYDRLIEALRPDMFSDIVACRELDAEALSLSGEGSWSRLSVRESVHKARVSFLKRS